MKLFVTFKQQNPDFDKVYAEEYHSRKESDGNWKDNWSRGFRISETIKEFKVVENGQFKLSGKENNGELFEFTIPNMTILLCITNDDQQIEIAVSRNLIKKTHTAHNKRYDTTRFYFYFTDTAEFINPLDTVYIDKNDFPKKLMIGQI